MNSPNVMGLIRFLTVSLTRGSVGSAAVEFAITAPVLVLLVLGAADYGAVMGNGASLEGATRAVAEYARNSPECNTATGGGWLANSSCTSGINNLVSTLQSNDTSLASATFTLPGLGSTPVSAYSTPGNYCTCTDGSAVSCSASSCKISDPRVLQYIQITATLTVSPLVSYVKFTFPAALNAQTTTRIQ